MKNTIFFIAFSFCLSVFAQQPVKTIAALAVNDSKAHISFETTTIDFGKIKKDQPVEKEFPFTNTGTAPLIITSAHPSCSCTVPHSPTGAIQPGHKEFIKAGYNARNLGTFVKTITVSSNADESNVILTIKGEVVE